MSAGDFSESLNFFPWYVLANDSGDGEGMGTVGDDSVFVTEMVDGESCLVVFTKEPLAERYVETKTDKAEVVHVNSFGEATVILENAGASYVAVNMEGEASSATRFLIDELLSHFRAD